jgi:hypothetical protein
LQATDGGRFCSRSTHAFCADFDDGQLRLGWPNLIEDPDSGALVTLSTDRPFSPPASLLTTLPRHTQLEHGVLYTSWNRPWTRTIVELDLYIDPINWLDGDKNSGIVGIEFHSSAAAAAIYLSVAGTYVQFGDTHATVLQTGVPLHAKFDVDPIAKTGTVWVDDQMISSSFTVPALADGPSISLGIGVIGFNAPTPEISVYYDNVTVDFP